MSEKTEIPEVTEDPEYPDRGETDKVKYIQYRNVLDDGDKRIPKTSSKPADFAINTIRTIFRMFPQHPPIL